MRCSSGLAPADTRLSIVSHSGGGLAAALLEAVADAQAASRTLLSWDSGPRSFPARSMQPRGGGRRRPGRRSPHSLSCPCCSEVAAHASASACALPWPKQVPSQRNVSEGRRKCMLERRNAFCRSHSFVHRMLSASAASEIDLWKWIWSLASRSLQSSVGHKR